MTNCGAAGVVSVTTMYSRILSGVTDTDIDKLRPTARNHPKASTRLLSGQSSHRRHRLVPRPLVRESRIRRYSPRCRAVRSDLSWRARSFRLHCHRPRHRGHAVGRGCCGHQLVCAWCGRNDAAVGAQPVRYLDPFSRVGQSAGTLMAHLAVEVGHRCAPGRSVRGAPLT